jgi:phage baseplate assembly protein gpV
VKKNQLMSGGPPSGYSTVPFSGNQVIVLNIKAGSQMAGVVNSLFTTSSVPPEFKKQQT